MQILKFKCRIKKEVKFKITPHNANSQNIQFIEGLESILMNQEINDIAHQTLEIISDISIKSQERLNQEKITNEILGGNSFTDNTHLKFEQLSNSIQYDNEVLAKEPAFMRVDLEDIDGSYFCSFYVSRVAVPTGLDEWRNRNINFISYRTPLGRIASLLCGDEFEFQNNEYYIRACP